MKVIFSQFGINLPSHTWTSFNNAHQAQLASCYSDTVLKRRLYHQDIKACEFLPPEVCTSSIVLVWIPLRRFNMGWNFPGLHWGWYEILIMTWNVHNSVVNCPSWLLYNAWFLTSYLAWPDNRWSCVIAQIPLVKNQPSELLNFGGGKTFHQLFRLVLD